MNHLLKRLNIPVPRYTSYPTVPAWKSRVSFAEASRPLAALAAKGESAALYVHIPFCQSLCWYCGCNTVIRKQSSAADAYLDQLEAEAEAWSRAAPGLRLAEIHWGGGTPNFLTPEQMRRLDGFCRRLFDAPLDIPFAVELDPRTVKEGQLETLRELGCRRLSLGIQDFDPQVQEAIHRIQPFELVSGLCARIRQLGFDSLNFDLIYGLPKQSAATFADTVSKALSLRPERVALFSYAHLPAQRPHMKLIKDSDMPSTEEKLEIFLAAREAFLAAGYEAVGMDHFALPADELARARQEGRLNRTFMGYTAQSTRACLGLGVSSISEADGIFWQNPREIDEYQSFSAAPESADFHGCVSSDEDRLRQVVIHDLMCQGRIDKAAFKKESGLDFDRHFAADRESLSWFLLNDLAIDTPQEVAVTAAGQLFVRNIAACFDAHYQSGIRSFSKAV
ncbi:MAG: hypothetical protein RL095_2942 [Verrucomicrobiota bacterium]|jgi:oxygen-independent coproporphyrinogen-3 oxidase